MVIPKDKFREIRNVLIDAMEYGADTVMCPGHCGGERDLEFCAGNYDEQLFYHDHPYDGDRYKLYGVRTLYETMILIEKQKLQALPVIDTQGSVHHDLIDLGKVVDERLLYHALHRRMAFADWFYEKSGDFKNRERGLKKITEIQNDLLKLSQTQYGIAEANSLWNFYVPEHSVRKPDFLNSSLKIKIMETQTLGRIEGQFKRAGLLEALTPDLIKRMESGEPEIKHPFPKVYDGDKTEGTLHLNKSSKSEDYFLNGFDLQLQKDGQAKTLKQYFPINTSKEIENEQGEKQRIKTNIRFTWKKAYNFLAGRPVYNTLYNKEGQEYQAWEKINYKKELTNGNFESKQYNDNYGFKLEKVYANYSIKELATEQYKASLIDSHQRGNLQKATFVDKDGKEEKLFTSPNITLGALNVYDLDKQLIPTETLAEKGYIRQDFAEELKNRIQQINANKQSLDADNGTRQEQKQGSHQENQQQQKTGAEQNQGINQGNQQQQKVGEEQKSGLVNKLKNTLKSNKHSRSHRL